MFKQIPTPGAVVKSEDPLLTRQSHFSMALPKSGAHLLAIGAILIAISVAAALFPMTLMDRKFGDFFEFRSHLWFASAVFFLAGSGLLVHSIRDRKKERCIEANEIEVAIHCFRLHRVIGGKTFPRTSVTAVKATADGHVNGRTTKRIELEVAGKPEVLAMAVDGTVADAFALKLRRSLGL